MARNLTLVERTTCQNTIIERLHAGESLLKITEDKAMPSWRAVHDWMEKYPDWAAQVSRAREAGYHRLAQQAYDDAQTCTDPVRGRLRLDATRWFLGKMSQAFSDNKVQKHEVDLQLSVEAQAWLGYDQKRA